MKGKLILTDIQSPVEGMQGYETEMGLGYFTYGDDLSNKELLFVIHKNGKTEFKTGDFGYCELKQIVVEYKEYKEGTDMGHKAQYLKTKTLPLHPDDWKWAIEHIGEEVEFQEVGITKLYARLIHPTPVTYTEEETRKIAQESFKQGLRFAHGEESNESGFRFNTIWNEYKKK